MSNRLAALLTTWFSQKDDCQWLLATIIETQRSSYRKAGAMMLINSLGKTYGLLSGGCLEADLKRQAQKCWSKNQSTTVCYDMQDEDDIAWQLGIGCGGLVRVLLQPITKQNNYLDLITLKTQLDNRNHCFYQLDTHITDARNLVHFTFDKTIPHFIEIKSAPSLVIFGGGIDAQPLVSLAKTLGWYVCLVDSRTSYARVAYFKQADTIINQNYAKLEQDLQLPKADAIVIMHHNIDLDAQALILTKNHPHLHKANYLGLLGPQHRTTRVLTKASMSTVELAMPLANPIGLDLGGDLPESIALAILSQAHASIEKASGQSLGYYQCPIQQVVANAP